MRRVPAVIPLVLGLASSTALAQTRVTPLSVFWQPKQTGVELGNGSVQVPLMAYPAHDGVLDFTPQSTALGLANRIALDYDAGHITKVCPDNRVKRGY